MADRLRPLWDFDDLDGTETRLRSQLEQEQTDAGRAEALTQLARVEGLRGEFARSAELLDEAEPLAGSSPVANVRLELERGRMYRSSGDPEAAYPLFQSAFDRAVEAGEYWLAGDAAHMCAIAVDDRKLQEEWAQRGLELAEREPAAAYWAGPLLNNLGWAYYDAGEHERALEVFERALEVRKRDHGNAAAIAWAQFAVGQTLRTLGRAEEAVRILEQATQTLPEEDEIRDELDAARA
jgi:tetratricopeptide (TPR) repeat protein